jgi:ketosteroid isomerase-like protein
MHLVSHGTHKGEYHGQAPTDKEVGTDLLYVMTGKDGKYDSVTAYANPLAYMSQIGAAPEGVEPVPVPAMPEGEPEVIQGEPNEANVEVVKAWYASFADGTVVDKLDDMLAADGKHHMVSEGKTEEGIESARKSIPEMMKAVSDVRIDEATYAGIGDYVLASGKWSGKHTGDMGPIKATNKEFSVDFVELIRVADGKIAESWEYSNPAQMMSQLGLIPEAGAAPAPTEEAVAAK